MKLKNNNKYLREHKKTKFIKVKLDKIETEAKRNNREFTKKKIDKWEHKRKKIKAITAIVHTKEKQNKTKQNIMRVGNAFAVQMMNHPYPILANG